ncbi:origin recognition complex subunit 5-like isoform X2 [Oscarella lobularis]|uniref:origin recognition complex subunit 5-like isoform X2 n=1 Tax=Oscarella lobularis TaxID=121494 RepID=UPI00331345BD
MHRKPLPYTDIPSILEKAYQSSAGEPSSAKLGVLERKTKLSRVQLKQWFSRRRRKSSQRNVYDFGSSSSESEVEGITYPKRKCRRQKRRETVSPRALRNDTISKKKRRLRKRRVVVELSEDEEEEEEGEKQEEKSAESKETKKKENSTTTVRRHEKVTPPYTAGVDKDDEEEEDNCEKEKEENEEAVIDSELSDVRQKLGSSGEEDEQEKEPVAEEEEEEEKNDERDDFDAVLANRSVFFDEKDEEKEIEHVNTRLELEPSREDDANDCHSFYNALPGRRKQIETLIALLSSQVPAPFIYVWGLASTGKTVVVQTVLKSLKAPYAFVSCVECYTQALLYGTILQQLASFSDGSDTSVRSCTTLNDFIRAIKSMRLKGSRPFYIALDKAERLIRISPSLPQALSRFNEIVDFDVSVIFITRVEFQKFFFNTGLLRPVQISFPRYSESNVVNILSLDCPPDQPIGFFRRFIQLLCSMCRLVCQDITEWRYLVAKIHPKYCEPIRNGTISEENTSQLFSHMKPHLQEVIDALYHFSSSRFETVDLPYYVTFALIAGYLASHNSPKSDLQMFAKERPKLSQRQKHARKKPKGFRNFVEPKKFALERVLAIFYHIVRKDTKPSPSSVLEHISTLVRLRLFEAAGKGDCLEGPKYFCRASFSFVQSSARAVDFNLSHYLSEQ